MKQKYTKPAKLLFELNLVMNIDDVPDAKLREMSSLTSFAMDSVKHWGWSKDDRELLKRLSSTIASEIKRRRL